MKTSSNFLSGLVALALLAAMGMGLYYMFAWIVGFFRGLDQQLEPGLIAAIVGVVFLSLLVWWTRNREGESRLLMEKAEVYQRFLTAWSCALQCPDTERVRAEALLKTAEQKLLLWGSSGVLRAYRNIPEPCKTPHTQAERWAVEKVIKAIRRDVKQQTVGLKEGDLLSLLLSEADSAATSRAGMSQYENTVGVN